MKECWRNIIVSLSFVLWLAGCPQKQIPNTTAQSFVVALEGRAANLDPRFALDAYSNRVLAMVMRGLTKIDTNGKPIGDLAASWHYQSPLTLDVIIKADQHFHDGLTITPKLVADSLNALRDPKLSSPRVASLDKVTQIAAGETTVTLYLAEPFAPLLVGLTVPIVHPGQQQIDTIDKPLGSGSFKFSDSRSEDEIILLRYSPVKAKATQIQQIVFRTIADPTARTFAMETGDADLAQNNIPANELKRFTDSNDSTLLRHPGWNVSYLGFNLKLDKFKSPELRRAILQAIDRDGIIRAILQDTATKTDSLIPPQHWAYHSTTATTAYDPDQAIKLLDFAGLIDPDGAGPKPRLSIEYKTSTNPERVKIAEAIRANLAKVGINVTIRSLEFGTFFDDIKNGNYEMYSLTWVGVIEPDLLHYALHSESVPPNGANRGFVSDLVLDELLVRARTTSDMVQRKSLYAKAQQQLANTLPVIPLWVSDAIIVQNKNWTNFNPLPDGSYAPLADLMTIDSTK